MALRVGIHSDSQLKDNCLSYNAFPVGFANADFVGSLGNPYLKGVKPPKYQRSAPKPVSADVMAVNTSRFMQGVSHQNARAILAQMQKEVKVWTPPPVKLLSAAGTWDKVYAELPKEEREHEVFDTVQPKLQIPSRGTQMVVQTITTQADIPSMDEILFRYKSLPTPKVQQAKLNKFKDALEREGIIFDMHWKTGLNWTKAQYGTKSEREHWVRYMIERAYAQGSNIDLIQAFTVGIGEVSSPTTAGESSPRRGAFLAEMGSESGASAALTQQGIALTETSKTTQEVEKK